MRRRDTEKQDVYFNISCLRHDVVFLVLEIQHINNSVTCKNCKYIALLDVSTNCFQRVRQLNSSHFSGPDYLDMSHVLLLSNVVE